MRREYEVPKAEKAEFDYTEAVVASTGCTGGVTIRYINVPYGCDTTPVEIVDPYLAN